MKTYEVLIRFIRIATAALSLVAITSPAFASDHQDSMTMVQRPGADITDVFVFPAADPAKVVLAMDVHPLIPGGEGRSTYFDPGVMYQFKIDTAGDLREHRVIQFKASGTGDAQQIAIYGPQSPNTRGTQSSFVGTATTFAYNHPTALPGGIKVFAGPRQDPFYFDLSQFFKLDPDRNYKNQPNPPAPSASCFRAVGSDFLQPYNVLSLIVEMPRTMLAGPGGKLGKIGVWATTSVASSGGTYTQIERLGKPAVKEVFETFRSHDLTNRATPANDGLLSQSIVRYMTAAKPLGAGRSLKIAQALQATLMPNMIEANLAGKGPARYLALETNGKSGLPTGVVRIVPNAGLEGIKRALGDPLRNFGGRDPSSPIVDLSLGAIYGSLVPKLGLAPDDHRETPCLTSDHVGAPQRHNTKTFPYIGSPV